MRRLFVFVATAALAANAVLGSAAHQVLADTETASTPNAAAIVATAEQYLGYPYAYIGDDPSTGFSCIGFVHFVFAQHGVYVPEDLSKAYASAPPVAPADLQPGDLVFFQNTVWTGLSHVDLYVGDGKMIGADTFQTGVQWDALSDPYWQQHYLGATRPLAGTAATPAAATIPATASATATPTALATTTPATPSVTTAPPAATAVATPAMAVALDASPTPSEQSGLALIPGATVGALHTTPVYNGPGDTYMGIDLVTPDVPLTVLQTDGAWVAVSYGGNLSGWVLAANLNLGAAAEGQQSAGSYENGNNAAPLVQPTYRRNRPYGPDPTVTTPATVGTSTGQARAVVTAEVLFVRAGPSTHTRILRRVHRGDRVSILATTDGWDYVSLRDGNRGWVSAQWVALPDAA